MFIQRCSSDLLKALVNVMTHSLNCVEAHKFIQITEVLLKIC